MTHRNFMVMLLSPRSPGAADAPSAASQHSSWRRLLFRLVAAGVGRRRLRVLVVVQRPGLGAARPAGRRVLECFLASVGRQVEQVIGAEKPVEPAAVGRIRVVGALAVAKKNA